jgi:uncharacterized membrane protein
VLARLPDKSFGGVSLALLATVLGLILSCFVAGIIAETALIRRLGNNVERLAMLVPGYALVKTVGANLAGVEGKQPVKTVLVRFEASWQLGFLMETLSDGRHVVFVPGVPKALVGTLHLITPDRAQILAMPVSAALDILGRLGIGLGEPWAREPEAIRGGVLSKAPTPQIDTH